MLTRIGRTVSFQVTDIFTIMELKYIPDFKKPYLSHIDLLISSFWEIKYLPDRITFSSKFKV